MLSTAPSATSAPAFTRVSSAEACPAHAARCRGVRACSSRALMSGFVCSNSVMAAASPVRAAACKGVVAPRGAESLAAGLLLWAVFFLKERFFGAIDAMYRALALLDRIGGKMPLWGLALQALQAAGLSRAQVRRRRTNDLLLYRGQKLAPAAAMC